MNQTPDYHVILVTDDPGLRSVVRRDRPLGARLLCVVPEEWDRRPELLADQIWIDLDRRPRRGCEASQRCAYFFSDRRTIPKTLSAEVLMRKPGGESAPGDLWAGVTIAQIADGSSACASGGCLPCWVVELNELELGRLLKAVHDSLPAQLGFDDIAVYLRETNSAPLVLAKTSLRKPLDRSIAADDRIHAIAIAARRARVQVTDTRVLIPLIHERESVGVIQLERSDHAGEVDTEVLARIGAVISKYFVHARLYERVRAEGRVDGLTGLFNYRWMREIVQKEVRRAHRFETPLSLLAIDLDHLKRINDGGGHQAGDACLRQLAVTVLACLREIDSAARIGGDEFLAVLPRTNQRGARRVAERIIRQTRALPTRMSTASIGVCELVDGWDAERLIEAADQAMYRAKRAGGDRAVDCCACADNTFSTPQTPH